MKTYKIDDVLDEMIGAVGTAERTKFDAEVKKEVSCRHSMYGQI